MKCSLTLHLIRSECELPCVLIVVSCLLFASVHCSDRKVLSAALLTLCYHRLTLCCLWRSGNRERQESVRVEMRFGAAACTPEELMRLRMIVWVKLAKSDTNWPIQGPKTYSNFYWLSRVKVVTADVFCPLSLCVKGEVQHPFLVASDWDKP